ncbi:MAG TPA: hypothetical protein VFM69_15250 [Pricia sp.]|nr:hypothetical protein [Pricia sp.]
MIVYKVTYTVKQAFIAENQKNISAFMADFKQLGVNSFQYNVYQSEDIKTFIHLSHYMDEEIQQALLSVPSFVSFQEKRDASGLEADPSIEVLHLVNSSNDIIK